MPVHFQHPDTTLLIDAMILVVLFVIIAIIYWKLIRTRQYWTRLGIKQIAFGGIITSNLKRNSFPEQVQYAYNRTTSRYLGIYHIWRPVLIIKDLNLIRQITVKDFDYFPDHLSIMQDEEYEPLWYKNLFNLKGQKWRNVRATLSPAFTTSKMRAMFDLMNDCAKRFVKNFEGTNATKTFNLKDVFTRYSNDVIATCAFGVQCDSMGNKDNQFYKMGKEATNMVGIWSAIKFSIFLTIPKFGKMLGLKILSQKAADFFINLVEETIALREEKKIVRPDMINLLMEARNGRLVYEENLNGLKETGFATVEESSVGIKTKIMAKQKFTNMDVTAQAFLFFLAGFDGISTIMCFMGYELAVNPDVQRRLFEEIQETLKECGENVTYEAINKLKYLDMVVSETLRKWPIAVMVDRISTKPYTIAPESDSEVPLTLEKGSCVWVPVWALHHDPEYFPNPDRFDPERFSDENKGDIKPYTYLPFGSGPRNCIGSRFALLEAKTVYFHLLSKFEMVVVDRTPIPLTLVKSGFVVAPEGGFWLGIKQRSF